MKLIFKLFRVVFLLSVFFLLGVFLAVLLLNHWSEAGQGFSAIVFSVALTWWLERKRNKGVTSKSVKQSRKLHRPKKTQRSSANVSEKPQLTTRKKRKSNNTREFPNSDYQLSQKYRFGSVDTARQDSTEESESFSPKPGRKQSLASRFLKNQPGGWIAATGAATIAGRDIGGLLYVGTPPRENGHEYQDACRAYIDPSLSVAKVGGDLAGVGMSYWPGYSEMSPQCRATYLDWLASGRSDASYSPGYMFLFFYGLERRFFVDSPNDDANDIVGEVARLRGLYPENRSVQRYLGDFLDVALLSERDLAKISPGFNSKLWEVPFSTKYAVGAKLARSESLDAEWLLAWFGSHEERSLRTPAERCRDEFLALFKLRFDARFPAGLKVNKPRKKLLAEYRAASGEFKVEVEPTLDGKPVPDISSLRKPIEIAQEIADEVMNDLDKLSRYLGRNKEGRGSLEAQALLPQELWGLFPSESLNQLESWAYSMVQAGGLVPVADVVERLEGVRPNKLTKRNLTGAADALARIGFGLAPDPRFALRSPKIEEPVVVFELGETVAQLENVSAHYRVALIETAVGSFVAHADGQISANERAALLQKVQNVQGLTAQEQRRLEANLNWMLAVSPDLALLRRKLKESTPETISSVRGALVSAAHADGAVQSEEVVVIEKIYKALGLDPGLVYSDLHAGDVQDGPVQVRAAEAAAMGEAIPPESQHRIAILDASRIAAIRSDTERVSAVLGDIFSETLDSYPQDTAKQNLLDGLDEQHTNLVQGLISKGAWTEDEVQGLCDEQGLMVSGAIETINEWAFEVYDEGLIDEYEGFEVAVGPAEKLRKNFAEESTNEQA